MTSGSLLDRELLLEVSEPWELAAEPGDAARRAVVKATDHDVERGRLLLEVDVPFDYRGAQYRLFTATARYEGSLARMLCEHGTAVANLYGIPGDKLPSDPFADWWRGGLGMIVTLSTATRDDQ